MKTEFENGDLVIDRLTGFEGQITATCTYLYESPQYLVTAKSKDGISIGESCWFDGTRLAQN